jgi:hypothetical protein
MEKCYLNRKLASRVGQWSENRRSVDSNRLFIVVMEQVLSG